MNDLPTGTLTYLFTDIVRSSELWQAHPKAMEHALARHDAITRTAVEEHHGHLVKMRGDGALAVFSSAAHGVTAAIAAQKALAAEDWPQPVERILVRMGLHTGRAQLRDGDYFGPVVNQAVRIQESAHGGQILLSQVTQIVVRDQLPDETSLLDLGLQQIRDFPEQQHVYQLVWPGLDLTFPPLKTLPLTRTNLPEQPTKLIGREGELADMDKLLADPDRRLVTITGPGGMGKTRFSVAAAEKQLEGGRFPNGVYFIALAPLTDVDQIPVAMTEAFGLPLGQQRTPRQQVLDYLRDKQMLLVMDNFEHLLAGRELVNEILQAAPDVTMIATSRERLQLRSEQLYPISGLEFSERDPDEDAAEYTAVKLLLQSVRQVQPAFNPQEEELPTLSRICRLVEGMPLALELAAGWVDVLSLEEIADEIQKSLDFLETEVQDVPHRQRSIRVVFDNSWQRLNTEEQDVFAQFSVFRGGFTMEAARVISGVSLRILQKLVNKSFLHYALNKRRYQIHELWRQYGAEKLSERNKQASKSPASSTSTSVRDRHSAYYCSLLQELATNPDGEGRDLALAAITADISNVYAAWQWAVKQADLEVFASGVKGLSSYYLRRGPLQEGDKLLDQAANRLQGILASEATSVPETAMLLSQIQANRASLLNKSGQYKTAITLAQSAIQFAQTNQSFADEAMAYLQWGRALWFQGNYEAAHPILEKALTLARVSQNRIVEADSLRRLGGIDWPRGHYEEANRYFELALSIYRNLGNRQGEALTLNNLSLIAREQDNQLAAKKYLEQAVAINRKIGDKGGEGRALTNLGRVCWQLGFCDKALLYNEQALEIHEALGVKRGQAYGLNNLGIIHAGVGDYEQAEAYFENALHIFRQFSEYRGESIVLTNLCHLFSSRGDWQKALHLGKQALGLAQEVGVRNIEAEAFTLIGRVQVETDDLPDAKSALTEALTIRQELGQISAALEPLAGLAEIARLEGDLNSAQHYMEQILSQLETLNLAGVKDPFKLLLTCYHILAAVPDSRDLAILEAANDRLRFMLSHISDPRLQKSFMENVQTHREFLDEYKKRMTIV